MARVFEDYLQAIKAQIASADRHSLQSLKDGLVSNLHNAFHLVKLSNEARAATDDLDAAFRALVIEISRSPLGLGKSWGGGCEASAYATAGRPFSGSNELPAV